VRYLLDTDHISFLQRRSSSEFTRLMARMGQRSVADFALSIVSFHEQVIGAHDYINRARTNTDMIRGYVLLSETLQGFATAPVLLFEAEAIARFAHFDSGLENRINRLLTRFDTTHLKCS
jgi:tRNA(fMet)-specific endonuclease VapC